MPARSIIPEILAKLEPYLELLDQQWESQAGMPNSHAAP
jgi:hypothetical protein